MSAPLLAINNVTVGYGNIPVLHGVSLDISKGEIGVRSPPSAFIVCSV